MHLKFTQLHVKYISIKIIITLYIGDISIGIYTYIYLITSVSNHHNVHFILQYYMVIISQ